MQCKNCGANLVRGFSFCLDCGIPVPPEALEESGLPQRNIDSGPQEPTETPDVPKTAAEPEMTGDVKPQMQGRTEENPGANLKPKYLGGSAGIGGEDLKPKLIGIGEESSGADLQAKPIGGTELSVGGADVHAAMQSSSSDIEDVSAEKLVFCPNCGMRMQHNSGRCDKCGMVLGPKPNSAPAPSSGVPLFNNDADAFGGQFGGLGGELTGLSDDDASRIDSFMNVGLDPMFNSGDSSFNVQATPDDFAQLNEQLANFSSAAGMTEIETTQSTLIRQKEPEKGMEREVMDFAMTDDLSSEPVPMTLDGMPVIGDYSMEENPDADINLDPYSFLYNSMDEYETKVREQYGVVSSDGSKGPEPISAIPSISANPTEEPKPSMPQAVQQTAPTAQSAAPNAAADISRPVTQTAVQGFAPSALSAPATAPYAAPNAAPTAPAVSAAASYAAPANAPYTAPTAAPYAAPIGVPTAPAATAAASFAAPANAPYTAPASVPYAAPNADPTAPTASAAASYAAPANAPYTAPTAAPYAASNAAPTAPTATAAASYAAPANAPYTAPASAPYTAPNAAPTAPASSAAASYAAPANAPYTAPAPAPTKRCYACGRSMPINDKFCPNCGRSTFGEPNPNRMPSPPPAPAKKKPTALIIILIIVVIAAAAVVFFVKNANAAEIYPNDPKSEQTDIVSLLTRSDDTDVRQTFPL